MKFRSDRTTAPSSVDDAAAPVRERRYIPMGEMRALPRESDDEAMIIEGYAIVYERETELWHGIREIIHAGAAADALTRSNEIVLWNHRPDQPMARRSNGTLEAEEDKHGVKIRADVSRTRWGRDGYEAIRNKVIDKMSFAFDVGRGDDDVKWTSRKVDGEWIDTHEIFRFEEIYDYSPVTYPAYEDTELEARYRQIAQRNRSKREASRPAPPPEASGDTDAAASEPRRDLQETIAARRRNLIHE